MKFRLQEFAQKVQDGREPWLGGTVWKDQNPGCLIVLDLL